MICHPSPAQRFPTATTTPPLRIRKQPPLFFEMSDAEDGEIVEESEEVQSESNGRGTLTTWLTLSGPNRRYAFVGKPACIGKTTLPPSACAHRLHTGCKRMGRLRCVIFLQPISVHHVRSAALLKIYDRHLKMYAVRQSA